MDSGPTTLLTSLGVASGLVLAATTAGTGTHKIAQIGGLSLAGAGAGVIYDGLVTQSENGGSVSVNEMLVGTALGAVGLLLAFATGGRRPALNPRRR